MLAFNSDSGKSASGNIVPGRIRQGRDSYRLLLSPAHKSLPFVAGLSLLGDPPRFIGQNTSIDSGQGYGYGYGIEHGLNCHNSLMKEQIQTLLQVDESTAARLDDIMQNGSVAGTPNLDQWIKGFVQPPEECLIILAAINIILIGHGVCPIFEDDGCGGENQIGWFVNRGAAFLPTIIYSFADETDPESSDAYEVMSLVEFVS